MEGIRGILEAGQSAAHRARKTPNAANQVQYPDEFYNSVPVITATPLLKVQLTTIIIATQSEGYCQESFDDDVRETVRFFNLDDRSYQAILLKPVAPDLEILDSSDAVKKMKQVVNKMNRSTVKEVKTTYFSESVPLSSGDIRHGRLVKEEIITTLYEYTLRIVSVGVASSGFIIEALQYMMNHWNVPKKSVQFVTNAEHGDNNLFDFWVSACVNELVQQVQFVNLQRYLSFGYHRGKGVRLLKTGQLYSTNSDNEPQVYVQENSEDAINT